MRLALYVTCLVDLMRPSVGFATLRLLEASGAEVIVPEGQTCCGQPAWSAGNRPLATDLAKKAIAELEGYDYVVIPSGSCTDQVRNVYPQLLAGDPAWEARARLLAERTYELTTFLAEVIKTDVVPGEFHGTVTYHDSCKGLRGLGIKQQPRQLLLKVRGLSVKEMPDCEECCGFGGAFSVKFADISTQIVDRKCASIADAGADAVLGGDLGCLINIEGRLRRRGDEVTRVLHIAEVLAGGGDS
ncbi:(Fe-S)-binding protein [Dechloromonas sp. HYN0024]|jgi:L-lactate dehydrogenase complex protein LldE|uniref:(Fe-S)-binding protein n=1 Tax=Dechloromonas sp. HYN0024 TaxID=2231055 RepID=UPI000E43B81A|nr:(Fe-S)-binding protein [Dechloromonas sp. HYN0024]AXS79118.1 (Fe-S)-binding protein [Dechloromonas sp. HYN0024]